MSWSPYRHHGLLRLDKTPRPVFEAFRCVFAHIPPSARILKAPDQPDGDVYAAAFHHEGHVTVALVNCTPEPRTRTVRILNAGPLKLEEVSVFYGQSASPNPAVEAAGPNTFTVHTPALGALCLRLKPGA